MPTAGPLHPAPATITLLLADDRLVVREGLKRIVAECPDMSGHSATMRFSPSRTTRRSSARSSVIVAGAGCSGPAVGITSVFQLRTKKRPVEPFAGATGP